MLQANNIILTPSKLMDLIVDIGSKTFKSIMVIICILLTIITIRLIIELGRELFIWFLKKVGYAVKQSMNPDELIILSPKGVLYNNLHGKSRKYEPAHITKTIITPDNGNSETVVEESHALLYKKRELAMSTESIDYLRHNPFILLNHEKFSKDCYTFATNPRIVHYEAITDSSKKYETHEYIVEFDVITQDNEPINDLDTQRRTLKFRTKPGEHKRLEQITLHSDKIV